MEVLDDTDGVADKLCDGVIDRVSKVVRLADLETVLEIEIEVVAVADVEPVALTVMDCEGDIEMEAV